MFIVTLSWCNLQQAHSSCHYMLPKECGFGYLHKLVLPPYAVSMPNTTLWSSCSQNRCRSATLSGELGVINTYHQLSVLCLQVENGAINLSPQSNLVFCHHISFLSCVGCNIYVLFPCWSFLATFSLAVIFGIHLWLLMLCAIFILKELLREPPTCTHPVFKPDSFTILC